MGLASDIKKTKEGRLKTKKTKGKGDSDDVMVEMQVNYTEFEDKIEFSPVKAYSNKKSNDILSDEYDPA